MNKEFRQSEKKDMERLQAVCIILDLMGCDGVNKEMREALTELDGLNKEEVNQEMDNLYKVFEEWERELNTR